MVCDYGMSPVLGALALGSEDEGRFYRVYGEHMAERVDREVHRLVSEARSLAEALLKPRLAVLRKASEHLLEVETLDADAMARLFGPRLAARPPVIAEVAPANGPSVPSPRPAVEARSPRRFPRPALVAALPFSLKFEWRRSRRKPSGPALAEF
jgi:cell division protease FtsH